MNPIVRPLLTTALALLGTTLAISAHAHHAFAAEFDADQPIELKGTVTKLNLVNPHSWIYLDVRDAAGNTTNWGFEFAAPFALQQRGLTKADVPPGSEITIKGFRAKNGNEFGYAATAKLVDGRWITVGGAQDVPTAATAASAAR